ncbi:DivIVA domain-containing protein [Paenibacillus agaridevorans]|uniref:DivIVA domain-containing protein n=1 Tax=Paenibacillus agaridevorans TaxID=171404 RepID=UPI001BE4900D|nr:DivIVA domain-containing protein [Paenibacillus agaridevorans]
MSRIRSIKEQFGLHFTPLDIHNKEFSVKYRGYDKDEVDEFLDMIIKDYEKLSAEFAKLQEQQNIGDHHQDVTRSEFTNLKERVIKMEGMLNRAGIY